MPNDDIIATESCLLEALLAFLNMANIVLFHAFGALVLRRGGRSGRNIRIILVALAFAGLLLLILRPHLASLHLHSHAVPSVLQLAVPVFGVALGATSSSSKAMGRFRRWGVVVPSKARLS